MAMRKSTGLKAGVERPREAAAPAPGSESAAAERPTGVTAEDNRPTITEIAAIAAAAAAAALEHLNTSRPKSPDTTTGAPPTAVLEVQRPAEALGASAGEFSTAIAPNNAEEGEEGEGGEDDAKLEIDDLGHVHDPAWHTPLMTLIENERARLHLADSILAGVDAGLDPDELHLEGERVSEGDHQKVICLVRRILAKSWGRLDSIYVGAAVQQAVETAISAREEGLTSFDAYSDTLALGRAKAKIDGERGPPNVETHGASG